MGQKEEAATIRDKFKSLVSTPGWKIVEDYIDEQTKLRTENIMLTPDTDQSAIVMNNYTKGEVASLLALKEWVYESIETHDAIAKVASYDDSPDDATDEYPRSFAPIDPDF